MPTYSIPFDPVPALDPFKASVVYIQDQNPQFARVDVLINNDNLRANDTLTFNGVLFYYSNSLNRPTDFSNAESFILQFNSNPDFNIDYEAVGIGSPFGIPSALNIRITAKQATTRLNIATSRATQNADTIEFSNNVAGQSKYSKNDLQSFAQLARITGTNSANEQVNEGAGYLFELSTQVQSKLKYFDLENANQSVIFPNSESFGFMSIDFGQRFVQSGNTIRSSFYDEQRDFFAYMGKASGLGLLTNRTGSKISSVELYELQSFLIYDLTSTTTLKRHISITYTDNTVAVFTDGATGNPENGIISVKSYVSSFSSFLDNSKTVKSWTVSLADSADAIIYEGLTYLNQPQPCVKYFQLAYTNEFGGFEVETFKTDTLNEFDTVNQVSKEASFPNEYKEFNFITDTIESIAMDAQNITENTYQILKALPQSKYLYVVDGVDLKPVRLTNFQLNENTFNASFKCLG